ncbi:MAG TPA: GNAT family N-acetyltransferase, partial [Rhodospirillales bacterium]|nr:GNAT family N-acetyltransferase [Rhodospirillales bacterium]
MTDQRLANIVWHCLTGPQEKYATGTRGARRYARGFSPILAFADTERPDFPALEPYCEIGEHFYCGGWSGPVPADWQLDSETTAHQMVWRGEAPAAADAFAAVRLESKDIPQALALVAITQPGPFGERTVELGEYYGVFDAGRLVAMAGERMQAGALREVSGVCTHPDYQGRGYARRLVEKLVRVELARNQSPFLHVVQENA